MIVVQFKHDVSHRWQSFQVCPRQSLVVLNETRYLITAHDVGNAMASAFCQLPLLFITPSEYCVEIWRL